MKLVKIEWRDVVKESSWVEASDIDAEVTHEKNAKFVSVGYLYEKSDEWIVILPSVSFDEDGKLERAGFELIPRGMVIRIITLKE